MIARTAPASGGNGESPSGAQPLGRGVKALLISQFVGPILQLLQFLGLTLFLGPGDFGEWVFPIAIYGVVAVVAEVALPSAIVAQHGSRRGVLRTWLPASIALVAVAAGWAYRQDGPESSLLLVGLLPACVALLINARTRAELAISRRFESLGHTELRAAFVSVVVAFGSAGLGAGVWSFVLAANVRQIYLTWSQWRALPSERVAGRGERPRTTPAVLYYLLMYLGANLDYLLGTLLLSADELGSYYVGYNLATLVALRAVTVLNRVTLPLLVTDWSGQWQAKARATMMLAVPTAGALSLVLWSSGLALGHFIPSKWIDAATVFGVLALGAGGLAIVNVMSTLLLSAGAQWRLTWLAGVDAGVFAAVILIDAPEGLYDFARLCALVMVFRACWWLAAAAPLSTGVPASTRFGSAVLLAVLLLPPLLRPDASLVSATLFALASLALCLVIIAQRVFGERRGI